MLVIPRGEFSIEDPWAAPEGCRPVPLVRATDGSHPRQATEIVAYYDDKYMTIVFSADDDEIVATMYDHDAPLWQEDVVEVFLAPPADGAVYFEIEVNPLGTTFDARIESPDGIRATMRADTAWTCEGLFAAVRRAGAKLDVVMRVPFAAIGGRPARGNFFRVDRSRTRGDEYSAWQPTMKTPADFHVVAAFGALVFD